MNWLYTIDPPLSGEENMQRDEAMAEACLEDRQPRLRFYTWRRPTLSLGFNQKDRRVLKSAIEEHDYDLVRRPTGGRAVLHADEITYGVAMPGAGRGVHETYGRISRALARGFRILGADGVTFARSTPDFRDHYRTTESEGCFSASALNELLFDGRKLVGSAQRRYGDILLQHGSILLGPAHLKIVDLLDLSDEVRNEMRRRLAGGTATLSEAIDGEMPAIEAIAEGLRRGFAAEFDVAITESDDITTPVTSTHRRVLSTESETTV